MVIQKASIVYYSGTGGTERVANAFYNALKQRSVAVSLHRLGFDAPPNGSCDLVILLYAVHAFNAPEPIYQWIQASQLTPGTPIVVCSVSGGGDVSPNTGCRLHVIKRLKQKGYAVIYEKMLVMPSNWIVPTKPLLAKRLLEVLPDKVDSVINDIEKDIRSNVKIMWFDRFLSKIGELEKPSAHYFGRKIRLSNTCNGCAWCANHCSASNIRMEGNRPVFGKQCNMCLGCIYGCPQKALSAGMGKFVVIKQGFDIEALEQLPAVGPTMDVNLQARGYLWSGIRKYLNSV